MTKQEKVDFYINHVNQSIISGLQLKSKCDPFPLTINGMSTPSFRCILNNLCSLENMTYLEIGTWLGGTICSAVSNNKTLTSFAMDNFTYEQDLHNVKNNLIANIKKVKDTTKDITFIQGNCFEINKDVIDKPIDIYLFDAEHTFENQKMALTEYIDKMNDVFIYIVDDYNWAQVPAGTSAAVDELKDKIKVEKEWTFLTNDGWDPTWHNGMHFKVVSKI